MPSSPGQLDATAEPVPKGPAAEKDPKTDTEDVSNSDDAQSPVDDGAKEPSTTSTADVASDDDKDESAPPLPDEPAPGGPPLPDEPAPQSADDGWDCQWDATHQAWFFFNRLTGKSQWENPRVPNATDASTAVSTTATTTANAEVPLPPTDERPAAGGYNPAIHGDYDPNAWYAQGYKEDEDDGAQAVPLDAEGAYGSTATFNRFTGQFQTADMGPGRHSDDAKSRRQMNAFFDVDAAANSHDGRSLKAERSNKKPSKAELKAFKEKRRARKEEKRRAWLRD